jgi:hypothetical protein
MIDKSYGNKVKFTGKRVKSPEKTAKFTEISGSAEKG